MQRLCQHTLIPVVEHIPTQSERIRGTEHVRLEQLRVPLADMLQGPALNNMVCDIFNWQLAKHIHMPRSSAKLAHPLAPWLSPEPASGDSKGVPATGSSCFVG
jgi:hypothetical protein